MPLAQRAAAASVTMSIVIFVVVALLLLWLWYERRQRGSDLSEEDTEHFARQDLRRALIALILGAVGLGIFADSRMDPRPAGRPNVVFLVMWVGVFVLL